MICDPLPLPELDPAIYTQAEVATPLADCLASLAQPDRQAADFASCLHQARGLFAEAFRQGTAVATLVHGQAAVVDRLLCKAWQRHGFAQTHDITLLAVGGYGRGELHPGSDVDILMLTEAEPNAAQNERLAQFITFLWDIGLKPGHSVHSLATCSELASRDITVATNLMEARLLAGSTELFECLREQTGPQAIWPSPRFYAAKLEEQRQRHHKFGDTPYRLEPNVKEGPGGLRDIQMIGWVAKRHLGAASLNDLVAHGFLTETEYATLDAGQQFLWQIRFALHILSKRAEDRLLFDRQRELADLFGYQDAPQNLGVEQLMQRYFRTVTDLERLNELLLQLYDEAILSPSGTASAEPRIINRRFQVRRGYLEVRHPDIFKRYPPALLEVFLLLQQQPELIGVSASTIRIIRQHTRLIDTHFRQNPACRALFMEILRQPGGINSQLQRMSRYGILGAYIPAFAQIVGRMQYDLFHIYTVDQHTLFVIRNLRRFALPEFQDEHPLCASAFQQLPKPELVYLGGLFHDIAKGRGGDHSELGAQDALRFCLDHGLSDHDAGLVAWLVRHHLLMSMTAQRKDIQDPEVVHEFATKVGNVTRLHYLFLLTVADIRATNPSLWNAWRDALLSDLYTSTKRLMRRGLEQPPDTHTRIQAVKTDACALLREHGLTHHACEQVWQTFPDDYFLRHTDDEIAWHTQAVAGSESGQLPLVLLRPETARGSTEIFVYTVDHPYLFGLTAAVLDQLALNVVDARIITSKTGMAVNTFLALEEDGQLIQSPFRQEEIIATLRERLLQPHTPPTPVQRNPPRRLRHFHVPTRLSFTQDPAASHTVLELITGDRPGLLSLVGRALIDCHVRVENAKIATVGEQAEDILFIAELDGQPVDAETRQEVVRTALSQALDAEIAVVDAIE